MQVSREVYEVEKAYKDWELYYKMIERLLPYLSNSALELSFCDKCIKVAIYGDWELTKKIRIILFEEEE